MIRNGRVKLWGTIVGYFSMDDRTGRVSFEYQEDFVKSGIQLSPIMMPLSSQVYMFPELLRTSFKGVPGLISDSLPDKFGNAVIDQWLDTQGRTPQSFNVVERLCYTGKRGMGALEYEPNDYDQNNEDTPLDLGKMAEFASAILQDKEKIVITAEDDLEYKHLLQLGTSAGGARAKAVIAFNANSGVARSGQIALGDGFEHWLVKFDGVAKNGDHGVEDAPEYTLIEYAYYKMALEAGIHMNECKLLPENGRSHFMTKRFDRVDGDKVHMQSLGALLHVDYNDPGLCSYERAAITGRSMGVAAGDIRQLYRRMVFNILAVNQDDHVKNISFLMDRRGRWSLSPAYDVTFAYQPGHRWLGAHQMTINGKSDDFLVDDLIQCGQAMDIKPFMCNKIISQVHEAVSQFEDIANDVGIRDKTISVIKKRINERLQMFN